MQPTTSRASRLDTQVIHAGSTPRIGGAIVQTVARGRDLHRPRLKLADKLPRLPEEAAEILMIHDPVSG